MFKNLQAELVRKGMTYLDFSNEIEMNYSTFRKKMNGKTEFNLSEMKLIKAAIGNDFTLEYLFEISEQ